MNEKRYAIVRVDYRCPFNVLDSFYCFKDLRKYNCKKCKEIVGVTKEQLVRQVMTAFKIAIKKKKEGKFIKEKSNNRQVAEIVVEVLGVK